MEIEKYHIARKIVKVSSDQAYNNLTMKIIEVTEH